jgi:hypothetical protein
MNIIQQQDRLKSLPEEALIEYVANPTGEVPTFLALGELERRKVMKNKYAAQQAERPPVAEQIVEESMTAMVPQGITQGLPQGMPQPPMPQGMPQPPMPREEIMSESIENMGIAANNPQNIGTAMAAGGIVGYQAGGNVPDSGYFSGMGAAVPSYLQAQESILGQLSGADSRTSRFFADQAAQLADDRAKLEGDSEREMYRALIRGGAAAAASDSPYALKGIASGIGTGFESYNQGVDKIREQENLIDKETRMLDAAKYADLNAQSAAFRSDYLKRQEIEADRLAALARANAAKSDSDLDKLNFKLNLEKSIKEDTKFGLSDNILNRVGKDRNQKTANNAALMNYFTELKYALDMGNTDTFNRLLNRGLYLKDGKDTINAVEEFNIKNIFGVLDDEDLLEQMPKKN